MRERYIQPFFNNVIELSDALDTYYVQDRFCDRDSLFGVCSSSSRDSLLEYGGLLT